MPAANRFEEHHRRVKADALTAILRALPLSALVRLISDDGWEALAGMAKVKSPSADTRALVARMLVESEATVRRAAGGDDAFAGLDDRAYWRARDGDIRRSPQPRQQNDQPPQHERNRDDRGAASEVDGGSDEVKGLQGLKLEHGGLLSSGDPVTVPLDRDIVDAEVVRLLDGGARVECKIPRPGGWFLLRTYPARMVERAPVSTVPRTAPEVPTKEGGNA